MKDDEFRKGDVLVRIGEIGEWFVVEEPITCYWFCPISRHEDGVPVLAPDPFTVSKTYASRNFVKVGHRGKWRNGDD